MTGTAIGILCMPKHYATKHKVAHLFVFSVLALIPDWGLPSWGHQRYDISHSIFVNSLIVGLVSSVALTMNKVRTVIVSNRAIYLSAIIAWLSHMLLDSLYNSNGIAIFWPFSEARLSLPIPWLFIVSGSSPPTSADHRIHVIEAITFAPVVALAIATRKALLMKRTRSTADKR